MNAKKQTPREELERLLKAHRAFDEDPLGADIGTYILDANHEPVKVDTLTWGRWFEDFDHRNVAQTYTEHHHISTVFLGLDHSFGDGSPPLLYETMVFGKNVVDLKTRKPSGIDQDMDRYCTWDEAVAGHERMVREVLDYEKKSPEENRA